MQHLSVIIPVLNEQSRINGTIRHVKGLEGCRSLSLGEIIIADGDPQGTTLNAMEHHGDPAVKTLSAPAGRAVQMNAGAARAQGDFLLFLHADTLLPESALADVADCLSDPRVGLGAFSLGLDSGGPLLRGFIRLADLRNKLLATPYGDQAMFMRREFFFQVGGFPDQPIMEDVDMVSAVRRQGKSVRIVRNRATTSARRWQREGLLTCTARNLMLRILHRAGVNPVRLAQWYRTHKGEP